MDYGISMVFSISFMIRRQMEHVVSSRAFAARVVPSIFQPRRNDAQSHSTSQATKKNRTYPRNQRQIQLPQQFAILYPTNQHNIPDISTLPRDPTSPNRHHLGRKAYHSRLLLDAQMRIRIRRQVVHSANLAIDGVLFGIDMAVDLLVAARRVAHAGAGHGDARCVEYQLVIETLRCAGKTRRVVV